MASYLTIAVNECVNNRTLGNATLHHQGSDALLRQRFSRPNLVYHPYVTTLPVFYISRGGQRETCFKGFLEGFSADMTRIEAVMLAPHEELLMQLTPVVDDPRAIMQTANTRLSTLEWRKRWGCLLAHLYAIHLAYQHSKPVSIILEDDAVPLYGSWTSTLEEFLLTLPEGWQAVQLQWSLRMPAHPDGKGQGAKLPYEKGSGWGTTAYALHRRGMEKLMQKLYNKHTGKFRVAPLVEQCGDITADDCLLGFTGYSSQKKLERLWRPFDRLYRATPPLFLHDSTNSALHKANYCSDLELSAVAASSSERRHLVDAKAANGVLLFFPVESCKNRAARGVLKANLLRANGTDFFLAYADNHTNMFEKKHTMPFKGREPSPSAQKLKLLQRHWHTFGQAWTEKYDYVWAINEDVKPRFSPRRMVAEAKSTGAVAVAPALVHQYLPTDQPLPQPGRHGRRSTTAASRRRQRHGQRKYPIRSHVQYVSTAPHNALEFPRWRNTSNASRVGADSSANQPEDWALRRQPTSAPLSNESSPQDQHGRWQNMLNASDGRWQNTSNASDGRWQNMSNASDSRWQNMSNASDSRWQTTSNASSTPQNVSNASGTPQNGSAHVLQGQPTAAPLSNESSPWDHHERWQNTSNVSGTPQNTSNASFTQNNSARAMQGSNESSTGDGHGRWRNTSNASGTHQNSSAQALHGPETPAPLSNQSGPQYHEGRCSLHYTNYLNTLAPMMPPAAWSEIFNETPEDSTFEGMDQMWCDSLELSGLWHNNGQNYSTACAVLDGLVAAHITDKSVPVGSSSGVAALHGDLGQGGAHVVPSGNTTNLRDHINRSSSGRYDYCVP